MFYKEKWIINKKPAECEGPAKALGLDPVTLQLLANRGASTEAEIRKYLYADKSCLHDPALMKDVEKAAKILFECAAAGKKVVISTDYDVDGVFSGELLYEAFGMLGISADVKTPGRTTEGYGINTRIVNEAADEGASIIITCDNGIAAFEAAGLAREKGLSFIITDHHEIPYDEENGERSYRIPTADAIVNPKQADCPYPFKRLCGCGVAFKLVSYMFAQKGLPIPDVFYEYAAIATVADVMDLNGENRIIVREGLKTLPRTKNAGLSALIKASGLEGKEISSYHIGFVLGPCFNAAGRLETPDKAIALLRTKDTAKAAALSDSLKELNEQRKAMTEAGFAQAIEKIEGSGIKNDKVILIELENCHESIVGIIAGRIKERYFRPTFVFTRTETCLKGSGRSIEGYHMYEALSSHKDLLLKFGGHALAAGLSIEFDALAPLRAALNEESTLTDENLQPMISIDTELPIGYLSEKMIGELSLLEPVGKGNPKPVFAEMNLKIVSASIIGKNKNVLRLRVKNAGGAFIDALLFSGADMFIEDAVAAFGEEEWLRATRRQENAIRVSLCYYPGVNEYMGIKSLQIIISHYRFEKNDNR
ncbi:MAG: single-stranded-DNA-specific exonuclease RecJ [Lachnospiraceae bacterium]|nr:single-stranded-DNA-specific exonuclease RecJ [Lachnospiraceae bacterium]